MAKRGRSRGAAPSRVSPEDRVDMPQVTERLCPACASWLCAAADAFCGACGRPCAWLALDAVPSVLPIGQVPPKVGLTLANGSCTSLRITRVLTPSWLEVSNITGAEIGPGASKMFLAKARTFGLREPESSDVRIQTAIGETGTLMMVIPEAPVLETSATSLEYWPDGRTSPRDYVVDCYPAVGHLRFRKLIDPQEGWVSIQTTLSEPILVARDRPLRILVRFDPQALSPSRISQLRPLVARATVEYDGPHGPAQCPVDLSFAMRRPPELTWTGEKAPPRVVLRAPGQVLGFTLSNALETDASGGRQNGRLDVREAVLRPPDGDPSVTVQLLSPLPLSLAGGESGDIQFQVNCQPLPLGIQYFQLDVRTSRASLDRSFRVPI